jgi:SAM-dependent methyltransferase
MKNANQWSPTKFVQTARGFRASRNPKYVGIYSRYIADLIAQAYETAIRKYTRGRLLDVGCGHVPLYAVYRDLVSENICVDWNNSIHANPFLDHMVDLNGPLPFDDGGFDTVLMTDVLEHIAEPANAIREVTRVMRANGTLILGVPFFYWLHEEPFDYFRYTEHALRYLCKNAGLTVREIVPYGGLPEVLVDLTAKSLGLFPRPVSLLLRPAHGCIRAFSKTWPCRKLSEASERSFPLGYVLAATKE